MPRPAARCAPAWDAGPECILPTADAHRLPLWAQGRAGRSGRATSLYTRRDAGIAVLLADALREAGQEVPEWLEPSSMAHLVYSEDYHSWDKVVLARRKAEGADVAAGGARVRCVGPADGRRPLGHFS